MPQAVSTTRQPEREPFGEAGHVAEALRDQAGVEGGAGASHPGDPLGAALVPPQPLPCGQHALEAVEQLGLLEDAEERTGVRGGTVVEEQRVHVGGEPVAVADPLADPGGER